MASRRFISDVHTDPAICRPYEEANLVGNIIPKSIFDETHKPQGR